LIGSATEPSSGKKSSEPTLCDATCYQQRVRPTLIPCPCYIRRLDAAYSSLRARARAVVLTLVEAHLLVSAGKGPSAYASQCPNCELLHLGPLGGRSISITAGRVAGRSQLGAPNRELVRPNFSAIPLETELGKGELARSPVIRRGPLPRAPKSVVCGTPSKRSSHLSAL
jgi:hypothetical protein